MIIFLDVILKQHRNQNKSRHRSIQTRSSSLHISQTYVNRVPLDPLRDSNFTEYISVLYSELFIKYNNLDLGFLLNIYQ